MEPLESLEDQLALIDRLESQGGVPKQDTQDLRADVMLTHALQTRIREIVQQVETGEREMPSWQVFYSELDAVAREMSYEYGVPTPLVDDDGEDDDHPLVLANKTPLRMHQALRQFDLDPYAAEMGRCGYRVRNSWVRDDSKEYAIVDSPTGAKLKAKPMAGRRMRKWFDTSLVRSRIRTLSADAELKAIEALRKRINESQFDSYVLSGCFPERSPRSDIHYMFRKGLPTLAMSYHGSEDGRVIAALCMHPMGYYQATFAGVMTPTDEVIAHLLSMRADERRYWAKSGQWSVYDIRAGV